MSDETVSTLFKVIDGMSTPIKKIKRSVSGFDSRLDELSVTMAQVGISAEGADRGFDSLSGAITENRIATSSLEKELKEASNSLVRMANSSEVTEQQIENFASSLKNAKLSSESAETSIDRMKWSLKELASSGSLTGKQLGRLQTKVSNVAATTAPASQTIDDLNRSMMLLYGGAKAAASGVDEASDEMDEASRSAITLAGNLGVLNSVASSSALAFSNLSVNIGPFNLALSNILTQLPTILTGMSTMLAIVTALVSAFVSLSLVLGTLFAGGALAFFEQFSSQFEESAEAMDALMSALRDLFTEALEPVMNEENMDLFISAIEGAARAVNMFAQAASQMREDVLQFVNSIDADFAGALEAMHDSFVIMMPILEGFLEFFINQGPEIIIRFAKITKEISGDVETILTSFGGLISELLRLVSVLLAVLAPAIEIIIGSLTAFFAAFNFLPGIVKLVIVGLSLLTVAITLVAIKMASLVTSAYAVHTALTAQAAATTVLGGTYQALLGHLINYFHGAGTLRGVLAATRADLGKNIAMWAAQKKQMIENIGTSRVLTATLANQLGIIRKVALGQRSMIWGLKQTAKNMYNAAKGAATFAYTMAKQLVVSIKQAITGLGKLILSLIASAAAYVGNLPPLTAMIGAMGSYATVSSVAAAATWLLDAALAVLGSHILLIVGAVVILLGLLTYLVDLVTSVDIFGAIVDGIKEAISLVTDLLGGLAKIAGFGMEGVEDIDTDDIQTDSNVDLSFEENLEQNVDVQADPEDKSQISRITKDAIEEANSFARRQEGGGG